MVNIFIFFQEKGNSIMPKGDKKYSDVCKRFMRMFIISMIFCQQLRIYDEGIYTKEK